MMRRIAIGVGIALIIAGMLTLNALAWASSADAGALVSIVTGFLVIVAATLP